MLVSGHSTASSLVFLTGNNDTFGTLDLVSLTYTEINAETSASISALASYNGQLYGSSNTGVLASLGQIDYTSVTGGGFTRFTSGSEAPEPSSLILLAVGMLAQTLFRKQRLSA